MFNWLKVRRKIKQKIIPDIVLSDDVEMGWMNIYESKDGTVRDNSNAIHPTKYKADEASDRFLLRHNSMERIACVLITFERGDGIE